MAKFAKWIGGGLGWAVGGPIGAIIGFTIGSVVDGAGESIRPYTGAHTTSNHNRRLCYESFGADCGSNEGRWQNYEV
jgi:hypothetical protein